MSTRIKMECDGCNATTETERVKMEFLSFNGRGYGFGKWHQPSITDAVEPTGWVWSDPYTSCTYCPTCWAGIESGETAELTSASQ